jgi:hypothetical protein
MAHQPPVNPSSYRLVYHPGHIQLGFIDMQDERNVICLSMPRRWMNAMGEHQTRRPIAL